MNALCIPKYLGCDGGVGLRTVMEYNSSMKHFLSRLCLVTLVTLFGTMAMVQAQDIDTARKYFAVKDYDKAFSIYDKLYLKEPQMVYTEYLNGLLEAKKLKDAEKLVKGRMAISNPFSLTEIDLGRVYKLQGKAAKAREQFDTVLQRINGDDMFTQRMAKAYTDAGETDYAVTVFEIASAKLNNIYIYKPAIANVYHNAGQLDKALDALISAIPSFMVTVEQVKSLFLEWVGNDPTKLQMTKKMLLTRMNEQPDNANYAELLTWIYIQREDWDGALLQIAAVDERNGEDGTRLLNFSRTAAAAHQYIVANNALDAILEKGNEKPLYRVAAGEKLKNQFKKLKEAPRVDSVEVKNLLSGYAALLAQYPDYFTNTAVSDYATVAAQYADSLDKGIALLKQALQMPGTSREMAGKLKLQLGDYYVVKGKVWDASLTYSQVDKDFRQDYLGEEARLRNAKLAYYRGDFKWAQSMLNVLKASTSELIANDALYLSVLITENLTDSNQYPLQRYAYADLLSFRNKDSEAVQVLDSIAKAYPTHALNDDILMTHANIAIKHQEFDKAITILTKIVDKFGQDVLGDDALYKIAELYRFNLNNKEQAQKYYEQLIIDFPGSTFVQTARKRLREITNPITP